ncbi:hypothetical protein NFX46_26665 [Streptomyces phaeoluteigriseus]|uniref:Lipoprotein n=1 Tax=Streptomyces phaeoluteigriseus TaxID=114686 RepID=A0ABY4ZFC4_9ACTN|nr:hypothetical protein [Streptomyces phaeoluteigriseus]USQ86982.1 hypothetical protein NFX46_26665 [Streptomyces phaeoluteigriseus]
MRHTTTLLLTALLLAGATAGCSSEKSQDEIAADCAAALTEQTGGEPGYKPTVAEAEEQVDALDDTLADMVRSGYEGVAKDAFDATETKTKEGAKDRPEACEPLSEDDYTTLLTAKALDGLGWTDEDGRFDKLKMAQSLGD